MSNNKALDGLFGVCVGDALGVPVEFKSREELARNPIGKMRGYGTHNQPPGTWSDDSSLTFCLADSLCRGYNIEDIAACFVAWLDDSRWTPHGEVFDIGITTKNSIDNIKLGINPVEAGGNGEYDNGNGSLMRILPLAFALKESGPKVKYEIISQVSSLTHRHKRSVISCAFYIDFAINILKGRNKTESYQNSVKSILDFYGEDDQISFFSSILERDISELREDQISAAGYVLDTLEASLWCFLRFDSYKEIVLKAVNMGDDTDTTGAVAGGLAGLYYGYENIPAEWREVIAKKEQIIRLAEELDKKYP